MAIRNRIIGRVQVLKHVSMSDISHWTQQGVSARCGVGTVVIRVLERWRRRKEEKDEAGKSDVIAKWRTVWGQALYSQLAMQSSYIKEARWQGYGYSVVIWRRGGVPGRRLGIARQSTELLGGCRKHPNCMIPPRSNPWTLAPLSLMNIETASIIVRRDVTASSSCRPT